MSENLKDLIDKAEEEDQSRAVMEKTIEMLKIEVEGLKNKLEEQKEPFRVTPITHEGEKEVSEEINLLKDMTIALRKDLNQKEQEKDSLNEKVRDLTNEVDQMKEKLSDTIKEEILLKTQNSLNNLIEDYSRLEINNKALKQKVFELQQEINQSSKGIEKEQSEDRQSEELKYEISSLKTQISSLENKNKSLLQDINLLETKSSSTGDIDILIEKLKENNLQLDQENHELNEKLEELKRDKLRMLKYEKKISELSLKINQLEETNKELKERDAILLAKTITAMDIQSQKPKKTTTLEKPSIMPIESAPTFSAPKVEPSLKVEVKKLEKVTIPKPFERLPKPELQPKLVLPPKPVPPPGPVLPPKPKELSTYVDLKVEASEAEATRKWQCPNCGNTNKAQIRELDDKTRIIYAGLYAKKYICGQCGKEWR